MPQHDFMKKPFLVLFFLFGVLYLFAQETNTVELKPIYKQGFKYYYDFKKVDGGAYGLQIPLQSLNDPVINLRYKNFKNYRKLEGLVAIVPLVYLFSAASSRSTYSHRLDLHTFYSVYLGSLAAVLGVELLSHHQLQKAIDRYNIAIIKKNTVGIHIAPVQNQLLIGLGFSHKFK